MNSYPCSKNSEIQGILLGLLVIFLRCGKSFPYEVYSKLINEIYNRFDSYTSYTNLFNLSVALEFTIIHIFGYVSYLLCYKLGPKYMAMLGLVMYEIAASILVCNLNYYSLIFCVVLSSVSYCLILNSHLVLIFLSPVNANILITLFLFASELSSYRYYISYIYYYSHRSIEKYSSFVSSILISIICLVIVYFNIPKSYRLTSYDRTSEARFLLNKSSNDKSYQLVEWTKIKDINDAVNRNQSSNYGKKKKFKYILAYYSILKKYSLNLIRTFYRYVFNKEFPIFFLYYFSSFWQRNMFISELQNIYSKLGENINQLRILENQISVCFACFNLSNLGFFFWSVFFHKYRLINLMLISNFLNLITILFSTSSMMTANGLTSFFFLLNQSCNICLPMAYCMTYSDCSKLLETLGILTSAVGLLTIPFFYYLPFLISLTQNSYLPSLDLFLILTAINFFCASLLLLFDYMKSKSKSNFNSTNKLEYVNKQFNFVPLNIYYVNILPLLETKKVTE